MTTDREAAIAEIRAFHAQQRADEAKAEQCERLARMIRPYCWGESIELARLAVDLILKEIEP